MSLSVVKGAHKDPYQPALGLLGTALLPFGATRPQRGGAGWGGCLIVKLTIIHNENSNDDMKDNSNNDENSSNSNNDDKNEC